MRGFYSIFFNVYKFFKLNYSTFANILVILFLVALPYFLFKGKFFIGGDDTRLFYLYPREYLINTQFFSWTNLSSFGLNFSYQSFLPFVILWTILGEIIKLKIILSYLSISLPLILGFIFFQRFIKELIIENVNRYSYEFFLGSLFYIFSPIIINNHFLNPLIPIWLIGLIPAVCYYFLKFQRAGELIDVLKAVILITIFSFGLNNSPWILGFLIPMMLSLTFSFFLFSRGDISKFIKRFIVFFGVVGLSQSFWLLGFLISFIGSGTNNFTTNITSGNFINDFARTVEATSTGTIIYPLLNLFHRQIAFDFEWNLKYIYTSFYDKTYFLNVIYIVVLFLGIFNFKKYTNQVERKTFIVLLLAFILSLYFFTVNIGPLKNLFLQLGNIPSFIIFRNAYDKFALGYAFIYALLITYCLVTVARKFNSDNKIRLLITSIFLLVTIVNILPIKKIIVSPIWTTKNIYKNIVIPQEYLDFMNQVKEQVSSTNNIFSIPYGISLYTVIKDVDSNNSYVGVSPVIIFSGVNDISGDLSFNYASTAAILDKAVINRDYDLVNRILSTHNMNYIFLTKNIPGEVKKSVLFAPDVLKAQDNEFISKITGKKIITSSKGNYVLYEAKEINSLISSDNLTYKKISRVKYEIIINNIKANQEISFNDSFHKGWNLYEEPLVNNLNCDSSRRISNLKVTECNPEHKIFESSDISYIFKKPVFENSHGIGNDFSNKWMIDPDYVKKIFNKTDYKVNPDGSIDLKLVLYFKPQEYFYMGLIVALSTLGILSALIIVRKNEK